MHEEDASDEEPDGTAPADNLLIEEGKAKKDALTGLSTSTTFGRWDVDAIFAKRR